MLSVRILQVLWVRSVRHLSQKNVGTAVNVIFFVLTNLYSFTFDTSLTRCQKCNNHCQLTITKFSDGSQFVSGNRCERGAGLEKAKKQMPNLYDYKYKRAFAYKPLKAENAPNGVIGIPRVLNIYENYPLWFTFFTELGFSVRISGRSTHDLYEKGIDSIPSESACYPANCTRSHSRPYRQGHKNDFLPLYSV